MSENDIRKAAKLEWLKTLSELWIFFGKQIDEERLRVYARDLSYVPLGLLEQAVRRAVREQQYHTTPTLRAVEDALCRVLSVERFSELESAIAAWEQDSFNRCVVRFGGAIQ